MRSLVLVAGLLALGIADRPAPAVAQLKPGIPAETLSFADIVDEASDDSFPASDPPAYLPPDRVGAPKG